MNPWPAPSVPKETPPVLSGGVRGRSTEEQRLQRFAPQRDDGGAAGVQRHTAMAARPEAADGRGGAGSARTNLLGNAAEIQCKLEGRGDAPAAAGVKNLCSAA
jgi:hypothetical protein